MDIPGAQRAMSVLAAIFLTLALGAGFWPVSATIVGNNSYSCGSGFVHSRHTWNIDSQTLAGGTQDASSPSSVCPDKVYSRRSLSITFGALAFVAGVAALVFGPPMDPSVRRKTRHTRPPNQ